MSTVGKRPAAGPKNGASALSAEQRTLFAFSDDDLERLATVKQRLDPELPALVSEFYDALQDIEPLAAGLQSFDPETVADSLVSYLQELLTADWSAAHIEGRAAIGLATGERAPEHIWFFGCSRMLQRLMSERLAAGAASPEALAAELHTLDKVLAIDLALASQAHREEYARQLAERNGLLETQNTALKRQGELRAHMAQMLVHDMAGPLSTLTTSTDVLDHALQQSPERIPSLLKLMRRNQRRLRAMMHDVLDVYSAEDTGMHLDRGPVDVTALVHEVLAEYDMQGESDLPAFRCVTGEQLPSAWADAPMLLRVLRNLLDNSSKYTPPEGVVEIRVEAQDSLENLSIKIIDSGPGIPLADREHIFDKYFTNPNSSDPEARTKRRGQGLGLAFCRTVVESHGGRIWIEEPPKGQGSVFALTLPAWDEPPI